MMSVSNFELEEVRGHNILNKVFYGTVDHTTGFLWWKQTERVEVNLEASSIYWHFTETGKMTPNHDVENLFRSWCARRKIKEDDLKDTTYEQYKKQVIS